MGRGLASTAVAAVFGVVAGLALTLAIIRGGTRPTPTTPQALPGSLLPEDEGPLTEVLFHYVPALEGVLRPPYRDFLGTLPTTTRLVAVVPRGARRELERFLISLDPTLTQRTRVVEVEGPISPWSKDRALVLGPSDVSATLLVPVAPAREWRERWNDWQTVSAVAAAIPTEYAARALPLAFDAGDFAVTGGRVIVDVNLLDKNIARGLTHPAELERLLEGLFARDVLTLGSSVGDVPQHHLSMYLTPLGVRDGKPLVLVGDPRLARAHLPEGFRPGELDPDTGAPLVADFSAEAVARHDRAATELAAAGFSVERLPTVVFGPKTYFAYTNGVYATQGGRRIAWVPRYGEPALDAAATEVYTRLGWEVRPVSVRSVYPFHGTIGCLVNVLSRSEGPRG